VLLLFGLALAFWKSIQSNTVELLEG